MDQLISTDFPKYNYADELASPRELGIKRDGSFDGIMRAVSGINYYSDSIGFGESTGIAKANGMEQTPLGVRFFTNTGLKCPNGEPMHEYIDTIPGGNLLGNRVRDELKAMGLPQMRGLAPGILEDATSALNPIPLLETAIRGGFPKCKQVSLPVGNAKGETKSRLDSSNVWIKDAYEIKNGMPHQTRWVLDRWMTPAEFESAGGGKKGAESFQGAAGCSCGRGGGACQCPLNCPRCNCVRRVGSVESASPTTISLKSSQMAAVALLAVLVGGLLYAGKR